MPTSAAAPVPSVSIFASDGSIIGERLSAKPFLEEAREWCENVFKTTRYSRKDRLWVEGNMKLSMYYGGQYVLYYRGDDDWYVLGHGPESIEQYTRIAEILPETHRLRILLDTPEEWDPTELDIPTAFL